MGTLSKEEKAISASYDKGEWKPIRNMKAEIEKYQGVAKRTLLKNARVNIRIPEKDLEGMRRKAFEEGIPYQTLMASVIHKYVAGRLIDKVALR